jgi:predicted deacetylase
LQESPIRIQWDPERTLLLESLPWRTIQIGVGAEAVNRYVDAWVLAIEDVTETVRIVRAAVEVQDSKTVDALLPAETPYPLLDSIAKQIDAEVGDFDPSSTVPQAKCAS